MPGLLSADTQPHPSPTIWETPVITTRANKVANAVGLSLERQGTPSPSQPHPM